MIPEISSLFPNQDILQALYRRISAKRKAYLVGGAVRDALLGLPIHDADLAIDGSVARLARQVANDLGGFFYLMDAERQVARVIYPSQSTGRFCLDFMAMRASQIEDDLAARDFTINAMAIDLHEPGRIIDPLGGAVDLEKRLLRACQPGSLQEDPVRILRAVRLSLQFGLTVEPKTQAWMQAAAVDLGKVSVERRRDELFRILDTRQGHAAMATLEQLGVLVNLLPELLATRGIEQSLPHTMDVWNHTLEVVRWLSVLYLYLVEDRLPEGADTPALESIGRVLGPFRPQLQAHFEAAINPLRSLEALLYLAGLYHDVAKPLTAKVDEAGNQHFYGHDALGGPIARKRGQTLALSNPEAERLELLVANHMRIHHLANDGGKITRRAIFRYFRDLGPAGIDLCLLSLADVLALDSVTIASSRWNRELEICRELCSAWFEGQASIIDPPRLLSGKDLIAIFNLTPGPDIGEILAGIREAQAAGEVQDRDGAIVLARIMIDTASEGNVRSQDGINAS